MTIYNMANILTGFIESIMMYMLYNAFCEKKDYFPAWMYNTGVLVLTLIINFSNEVFHIGVINITVVIMSFFAMSFLYKGKLSVKITLSVINCLIIVITEMMVLFGVSLLFEISVKEAVENQQYRLLGIVISKIISLLTVKFIGLKCRNKSVRMGTSYWILFFAMFVSLILTLLLIFELMYGLKKNYIFSAICSFGLMVSTFFALYIYEHLAEQEEIIRKNLQYEQNLKAQIKHMDEIVITQNNLKKFKHDFLNYEIGLKSYLKNNNCAGALEYLNNLSEDFIVNNSFAETGNTAFDAILSSKKAIAENKGIKFNAKIKIPSDLSSFISPIDMCIVFGNAIDNAIEACEKIKDEDKEIDITFICQGEKLFCKIINSVKQNNKFSLKTSKSDFKNHGFGLENIKASLAKYDSIPITTQVNDKFILKFTIFVK